MASTIMPREHFLYKTMSEETLFDQFLERALGGQRFVEELLLNGPNQTTLRFVEPTQDKLDEISREYKKIFVFVTRATAFKLEDIFILAAQQYRDIYPTKEGVEDVRQIEENLFSLRLPQLGMSKQSLFRVVSRNMLVRIEKDDAADELSSWTLEFAEAAFVAMPVYALTTGASTSYDITGRFKSTPAPEQWRVSYKSSDGQFLLLTYDVTQLQSKTLSSLKSLLILAQFLGQMLFFAQVLRIRAAWTISQTASGMVPMEGKSFIEVFKKRLGNESDVDTKKFEIYEPEQPDNDDIFEFVGRDLVDLFITKEIQPDFEVLADRMTTPGEDRYSVTLGRTDVIQRLEVIRDERDALLRALAVEEETYTKFRRDNLDIAEATRKIIGENSKLPILKPDKSPNDVTEQTATQDDNPEESDEDDGSTKASTTEQLKYIPLLQRGVASNFPVDRSLWHTFAALKLSLQYEFYGREEYRAVSLLLQREGTKRLLFSLRYWGPQILDRAIDVSSGSIEKTSLGIEMKRVASTEANLGAVCWLLSAIRSETDTSETLYEIDADQDTVARKLIDLIKNVEEEHVVYYKEMGLLLATSRFFAPLSEKGSAPSLFSIARSSAPVLLERLRTSFLIFTETGNGLRLSLYNTLAAAYQRLQTDDFTSEAMSLEKYTEDEGLKDAVSGMTVDDTLRTKIEPAVEILRNLVVSSLEQMNSEFTTTGDSSEKEKIDFTGTGNDMLQDIRYVHAKLQQMLAYIKFNDFGKDISFDFPVTDALVRRAILTTEALLEYAQTGTAESGALETIGEISASLLVQTLTAELKLRATLNRVSFRSVQSVWKGMELADQTFREIIEAFKGDMNAMDSLMEHEKFKKKALDLLTALQAQLLTYFSSNLQTIEEVTRTYKEAVVLARAVRTIGAIDVEQHKPSLSTLRSFERTMALVVWRLQKKSYEDNISRLPDKLRRDISEELSRIQQDQTVLYPLVYQYNEPDVALQKALIAYSAESPSGISAPLGNYLYYDDGQSGVLENYRQELAFDQMNNANIDQDMSNSIDSLKKSKSLVQFVLYGLQYLQQYEGLIGKLGDPDPVLQEYARKVASVLTVIMGIEITLPQPPVSNALKNAVDEIMRSGQRIGIEFKGDGMVDDVAVVALADRLKTLPESTDVTPITKAIYSLLDPDQYTSSADERKYLVFVRDAVLPEYKRFARTLETIKSVTSQAEQIVAATKILSSKIAIDKLIEKSNEFSPGDDLQQVRVAIKNRLDKFKSSYTQLFGVFSLDTQNKAEEVLDAERTREVRELANAATKIKVDLKKTLEEIEKLSDEANVQIDIENAQEQIKATEGKQKKLAEIKIELEQRKRTEALVVRELSSIKKTIALAEQAASAAIIDFEAFEDGQELLNQRQGELLEFLIGTEDRSEDSEGLGPVNGVDIGGDDASTDDGMDREDIAGDITAALQKEERKISNFVSNLQRDIALIKQTTAKSSKVLAAFTGAKNDVSDALQIFLDGNAQQEAVGDTLNLISEAIGYKAPNGKGDIQSLVKAFEQYAQGASELQKTAKDLASKAVQYRKDAQAATISVSKLQDVEEIVASVNSAVERVGEVTGAIRTIEGDRVENTAREAEKLLKRLAKTATQVEKTRTSVRKLELKREEVEEAVSKYQEELEAATRNGPIGDISAENTRLVNTLEEKYVTANSEIKALSDSAKNLETLQARYLRTILQRNSVANRFEAKKAEANALIAEVSNKLDNQNGTDLASIRKSFEEFSVSVSRTSAVAEMKGREVKNALLRLKQVASVMKQNDEVARGLQTQARETVRSINKKIESLVKQFSTDGNLLPGDINTLIGALARYSAQSELVSKYFLSLPPFQFNMGNINISARRILEQLQTARNYDFTDDEYLIFINSLIEIITYLLQNGVVETGGFILDPSGGESLYDASINKIDQFIDTPVKESMVVPEIKGIVSWPPFELTKYALRATAQLLNRVVVLTNQQEDVPSEKRSLPSRTDDNNDANGTDSSTGENPSKRARRNGGNV